MNKTFEKIGFLVTYSFLALVLVFWTMSIVMAWLGDWSSTAIFNDYNEGLIEVVMTFVFLPITLYYLSQKMKGEGEILRS
jgi:hypothetical protein